MCTCTCLHCTAPYHTTPHCTASVTCLSVHLVHPASPIWSLILSLLSVDLSNLACQSADLFNHSISVTISVLQQNMPLHCTTPHCIITTALMPIDSNSHLLQKESSQACSGNHGSFTGDRRWQQQAERAHATGTLHKKQHARPSYLLLWHNTTTCTMNIMANHC